MVRTGLTWSLPLFLATQGQGLPSVQSGCKASGCQAADHAVSASESLLMQVRHQVQLEKGSRDSPESSGWQLGMNIHPSDGHDFGYRAEWDESKDVGSSSKALSADFLSKAVWAKKVSHVAIVRHNDARCEAAKVWRLKESDKSMLQYFQNYSSGRVIVSDGVLFSFNDDSVTLPNHGSDPIFGVGGDLAFNWWYSNNGARIALSGGHLSAQGANDDDTHGLGNEFGGNTAKGQGSDAWTHDVANVQGDCHGGSCKIQGTDHGSHLKSGPVFGQYAIYVLETSTGAIPDTFPCPGGALLATSMEAMTTTTTTTLTTTTTTTSITNDLLHGLHGLPGLDRGCAEGEECPSGRSLLTGQSLLELGLRVTRVAKDVFGIKASVRDAFSVLASSLRHLSGNRGGRAQEAAELPKDKAEQVRKQRTAEVSEGSTQP